MKATKKQEIQIKIEAIFINDRTELITQETQLIHFRKDKFKKYAWKYATKKYEQLYRASAEKDSIFNADDFKDIKFTFILPENQEYIIWSENINFKRLDLKSLILKIFSYTYIPAQYIFVRVWLFGISPLSIEALYHGFNIAPIVATFLEFVALLPGKTLTLELILVVLTHFLPYALKFLWHGRYILIYTIVLYQLLRYVQYQISTILYNLNIKFDDVFCIMSGAPGTGKSSSALYQCIIAARRMWQNLKHLYWLYKPFEKKILQENNSEKLKKWQEIKEAYLFWKDENCIKCFASNIPIQSMLTKQMALRITRGHLYQEKRLPAYTVWFVDEISSMVDVTDSNRDRPLEVADLFRWSRHFAFTIRATEQDANRVQIDMRRVAGYIRVMLKQRWVCKPIPLLFLYYLIDFILYLFPANKVSSRIVLFLRALAFSVGFRKYTYRLMGNTEQPGDRSLSRRKRRFVVPAMLNARYDDRTFREFYKPLNQAIEYDIFPGLQMRSEHMESFLRKKKAELLQEDPELNELVYSILQKPSAAEEFKDFLDTFKNATKYIEQMSIQKIYDKAKEIKEKYDNENIYKLAEYIEKNNKAREAYNKFIQRNNAFKKADKALIATIANNYDAIAEEVKKAVKKA